MSSNETKLFSLLTMTEIEKYLRISHSKALRMKKTGDFPISVKVGFATYVDEKDLVAWVEAKKSASQTALRAEGGC